MDIHEISYFKSSTISLVFKLDFIGPCTRVLQISIAEKNAINLQKSLIRMTEKDLLGKRANF